MFDGNEELEPQYQANGYNYTEDKNNGDDIKDGHADDNDGTDVLCALCDDGGKLLSCTGHCKRSFHPRKKDGRESKCKTLGYTSEELKRIGSYLCKNCEYKKHQCFRCGGLEPSDEPNAKVFKCKDSACGYFYHPKCVAKLLEPDDTDGDENYELAKRIMEGMPFTCPVHWCFECGRMEDRSQRALQFALCRRCPKSYHRECLPRGISFDTKDKQVKQRAWELSNIIMIYCLDHKICKATGNAKRDHIKFPVMPVISKVSHLCEKKVKMIGKKRRSIGQLSRKSIRDIKRLRSEKNKHTKGAASDSSFERMFGNPENPGMCLKRDLQIESSVLGAAGLIKLEASKGQGKKFQNLSSFFMGNRLPSHAAGSKSGKRQSRPQKETSKCVLPSEGMFDHSVQQDTFSKKPSLHKDAELENEICKISEDRDEGNKKEKSSEHFLGKVGASNKVTTRENKKQNDVPRKLFMDKHAEQSRSKSKSREEKIIAQSREERIIAQGGNEGGCNSVSRQGDIFMRKSQFYERPDEQDPKLEVKIARNDSTTSGQGNVGVTPDHVDVPPEKQMIAQHVHRTTDKINHQPDYGCNNEDGQVLNWGNAFREEPKNFQCNGDSRVTGIDVSGNQSIKIREFKRNATDLNSVELKNNRRCIGDGQTDHFSDINHQYPSKLHAALMHVTGSSRGEHLTCSTKENSSNSPMGPNAQKKLMNHVTEGQRSYCDLYDQNPGNNNQYRYGHQCQVNYSTNDNYDLNRWGNTQSAFTPACFGAGPWHGPFSYGRGPENGITGWQSPPFRPRSIEYSTSRWYSPSFYPRRPEHTDYTTYQNNLSNFNHGEYHAMGTDPSSRYFPPVNNNGVYQPHIDLSVRGHGAMYGGSTCNYGVRSNYAFGQGPRTPAGGLVTSRYAPRLEQTNYQPRDRSMF